MSNWTRKKVGEISESCLGKMLDKDKNKGELQPYLSNKSVRWGTFDLDNLSLMRFEQDEEERYGLKIGDLVVCEGGEPGRCAIWNGKIQKMKIQKALHRVRVKPDYNSHFLYYQFLLAGKTGDLDKHFIGSTIKHLTGVNLKQIEFDFPSLQIQKKIANVLSTLDDKIELNNRINAELESMAKTLYDYWFVQFDFPNEENKPYKTSGGAMVWSEDLKREIPEGWEVLKLENIVKIRNGFAFKSDEYVENGIPIIRTKNFDNGSILLDDIVYISSERIEEFKDYKLNKFDFLLVMVGASVGKTVITPSYILPALQNQNMWNFIAIDEYKKNYMNFNLKNIVKDETKSAGGSAREFFRKDYFYSMFTYIPSDEIIQKFDISINPLLLKIDNNITENQQLATLRDWLLPMLMNGQVVVE
jgi:type I restriction enzyme S subunit